MAGKYIVWNVAWDGPSRNSETAHKRLKSRLKWKLRGIVSRGNCRLRSFWKPIFKFLSRSKLATLFFTNCQCPSMVGSNDSKKVKVFNKLFQEIFLNLGFLEENSFWVKKMWVREETGTFQIVKETLWFHRAFGSVEQSDKKRALSRDMQALSWILFWVIYTRSYVQYAVCGIHRY